MDFIRDLIGLKTVLSDFSDGKPARVWINPTPVR